LSKSKLCTIAVALFLVLCLSANSFTVFGAATPVSGAYVYANGNVTDDSSSTTSGASGTFLLNGATGFLDSDNYTLSAVDTGFVDTTVNNIAVTAGSTTSGVVILMPVSGGVSGTVTDATSGAPISSASVIAETVSGTGEDYALTSSNGGFFMASNLPTGLTTVSVSNQVGYMDNSLNVSVTE